MGTYGNVTMAKNQERGAQIAQMGITKIYPEKPDAKRVVMAPLQVTHQNAKIGLRALREPTSSSMEIHPNDRTCSNCSPGNVWQLNQQK